MKKTFRRVLASMLAVLMVLCSIPFTASAAQGNRKWWVDDGVDPATITAEPEFWGYNSPEDPDHQPGGPWYLTLGTDIDFKGADGYEDHRDDYKPIIAVTVSSQGENGMAAATLNKKYYNKYYGASAAQTYEAVKAAGNLLNPAELKAGQRIAVSFEFGGVDTLNMGQFHGSYDMNYLKPAYYSKAPARSDTWAASTTEGQALIKSGDGYYGEYISFTGGADLIGNYVVSGTGKCIAAGQQELSEFVGTGKNDPAEDGSAVRSFGQYGIYFGTLSFEVLQDCDLKDVLTFTENPVDAGNVFKVFYQDKVDDGKYCVTIDDRDCTFANACVVWSEYSKSGSTECTHANLTATPEVPATCLAAGTAAYWTCNDCGKMFSDASATTEISAPVTLDKLNHSYTGAIKSNGDGTHSYLCVNGCNQYGGKVNCTFGEMSTVKPPTITNEGTGRYTCGECGYYYDVVLDKVECTHSNLTKTDEVPATCLAAGTAAYWTCKDCGKMFSDASATTEISAPVTLDKLNHSYTGAIKSNGDGTHSYLCVNGCNQYGGKVNCTFGEMSTVKPPTITNEGTGRYTCGECGYYYDVVLDKVPCTHEHTEIRDAKDAELDVPGYTGDTWCLDCGKKIATGTEIPALKGFTVKVDAVDLGTVTLNGEDATAGVTKRVLAGSKVTLTATPVEGAKFVGWTVNGATTVSTEATIEATVLADVTYTPVFAIDKADEFTVTFVDSFGNVISAQTVTSGSAITVPAAPARPGYTAATENGWSMTNDEIAALTASATITAQYVKDAEKTFTVTATGCDITVNGVTTAGTATDVAYDTLVTVKAADATAWEINGVTVAYGDTYTFYVSSDVTLTKVVDAVTATPTIANVSVTTVTSDIKRAVFTATRSMTDDCTFVDAGFVYGKGDLGEITLDDVTGTTVKAAYVKTPVEQFSLMYGLRAQTGTMTARAFLAYIDAEGNTQVIYAAPQTYTY